MTPRTVLITGASGGVGRGIALSCAEVGWTVWIMARRDAEGGAVAAEVDAAGGIGRFVRGDVGTSGDVAAAIAEIVADGPLHGIVHNATSGRSSVPLPFGDVALLDVLDQTRVSVDGLVHLTRHAWPHLAQAAGSIVALTSEAAFEGKKRLATYATVKAAEKSIARTLARELGPRGVRVNCVAPLAQSPAMVAAFAADASMADRVHARIPLDRVGDARTDIGPAVRFLLSEDARYITGQTLMVDGGSCPIA